MERTWRTSGNWEAMPCPSSSPGSTRSRPITVARSRRRWFVAMLQWLETGAAGAWLEPARAARWRRSHHLRALAPRAPSGPRRRPPGRNGPGPGKQGQAKHGRVVRLTVTRAGAFQRAPGCGVVTRAGRIGETGAMRAPVGPFGRPGVESTPHLSAPRNPPARVNDNELTRHHTTLAYYTTPSSIP